MSLKLEWRPVCGYEGDYEVSNYGDVRSLKKVLVRSNGRRFTRKGRVLKPCPIKAGGHLLVCLSTMGVTEFVLVHRLVLKSFVGPCPDGMEACHNNGDVKDNRVSNLRWDTHTENMRDAVRHGRNKVHLGEKHPLAKLTVAKVRAIRKAYRPLKSRSTFRSSHSASSLARKYGVSGPSIMAIVKNKTWKGV